MTDDPERLHAELFLQSAEAWWRSNKEEGKRALIQSMAVCVKMDIPWPQWVKDGFLDAYSKAAGSWDEVFGRPLPPRKKASKKQHWDKFQLRVFRLVRERNTKKNEPIDEVLFEKVGKKIGISGSNAREMYYDALRQGKKRNRSLATVQLTRFATSKTRTQD